MITKIEPTISIIIPVYNEEKVLLTALQALEMLPVEEVIFVDGGSTDKSRKIINDHGYKCLTSKTGRAMQMNTGTKASEGDIILYLHIDTTITSSNLSDIRKSYIQGYLSGRCNISFTYNTVTYRIISFFINIRSRLTKISTGDQAMFMRRDAFEQIGGFPDIPLMEDIAMSKKLKKLGHVACLSSTVVTSSRRWQNQGIFRTILQMWVLRLFYWLGASPFTLAKMYKDSR